MMPHNIKDTIIINIFGGPGIGKSTVAAGVFYKLKVKGVNVEYIPEYAKDLYWTEDNKIKNQLYVTVKQYMRQMIPVIGKVDIAVTDTSILMGTIYKGFGCTSLFEPYIVEIFNEFNNFNVLIERNLDLVAYDESGRYQDLTKALEADADIKNVLDRNSITYHSVKMEGEDTVDQIVKMVLTYKQEEVDRKNYEDTLEVFDRYGQKK